ncbi:hypothetical protein F7725_010819 [Dissostichus mawsoni]|uniref:Uncharacterized protein n=1 Tax=Dissostichus mawsoni TaxID=36200 RepID=A0A7J5ZA83_DISMA|nr:hypothetical protein F7725_010819 [Dissostichus mawsoni]
MKDSLRRAGMHTVWNTMKDSLWRAGMHTVWNTMKDSLRRAGMHTVWNTMKDSLWRAGMHTVWNTMKDSLWRAGMHTEVIQRRSVSRTLNTTVFMKRSRSPSTILCLPHTASSPAQWTARMLLKPVARHTSSLNLSSKSGSSPEDEFARAVIHTEHYAVSKTSETLNSRRYNA